MKGRKTLLIIDGVYVKSVLQFHGGIVFGKADKKPSKLTNTVLRLMLFAFLVDINSSIECFL